jgi:hypothetical protein
MVGSPKELKPCPAVLEQGGGIIKERDWLAPRPFYQQDATTKNEDERKEREGKEQERQHGATSGSISQPKMDSNQFLWLYPGGLIWLLQPNSHIFLPFFSFFAAQIQGDEDPPAGA